MPAPRPEQALPAFRLSRLHLALCDSADTVPGHTRYRCPSPAPTAVANGPRSGLAPAARADRGACRVPADEARFATKARTSDGASAASEAVATDELQARRPTTSGRAMLTSARSGA